MLNFFNRVNEARDLELDGYLDKLREARKAVPGATQEIPAVRPCGGTYHCVTSSGSKAKQDHKGCS